MSARSREWEPELEELGRRWGWAKHQIATLGRSDVRRGCAVLALVILGHSCPLGGTPSRREYIRGAMVGATLEDLQRWWPARFGEAPCTKTITRHLELLERARVFVTAPGAPTSETPWRPKEPPTRHLIFRERDAEWWRDVGEPRLRRHADAEREASLWQRWFGTWREEARQAVLDFERPRAAAAKKVEPEVAAERLRCGARAKDPHEMLVACRDAGVALLNRVQPWLLAQPRRLAGAMEALARELLRAPVHNPAGWLVWAFKFDPGRL